MHNHHLIAPALAGVLALLAPPAQAQGPALSFSGLIGSDLTDGATPSPAAGRALRWGPRPVSGPALDPSSGVDLRLHRSDAISTRAVVSLVTEFNLR